MRVEALIPDAPERTAIPSHDDARAFGGLVDAATGAMASADDAERAFIAHRGGLQEMVVERARADIALQIAATGAARTAQGLQTLLGMQI